MRATIWNGNVSRRELRSPAYAGSTLTPRERARLVEVYSRLAEKAESESRKAHFLAQVERLAK